MKPTCAFHIAAVLSLASGRRRRCGATAGAGPGRCQAG